MYLSRVWDSERKVLLLPHFIRSMSLSENCKNTMHFSLYALVLFLVVSVNHLLKARHKREVLLLQLCFHFGSRLQGWHPAETQCHCQSTWLSITSIAWESKALWNRPSGTDISSEHGVPANGAFFIPFPSDWIYSQTNFPVDACIWHCWPWKLEGYIIIEFLWYGIQSNWLLNDDE